MNTTEGDSGRPVVGIVTDPPNVSVRDHYDAQIAQGANSHGFTYKKDSASVIESIGNEIADQFRQDYDVLVAALGVPQRAEDYRVRIHRLLEKWSEAEHKPVLLLVSEEPETARRIVNEWPNWQKLSEELQQPVDVIKQAVHVNKRYLGASTDVLGDIAACIQTATELKGKLSPKRNPVVKPSDTVAEPEISEHTLFMAV